MNYLSKRKGIALLLTIIMLMQFVMPMDIAKAANVLIISHQNATTPTETNSVIYTDEIWNGRVGIDGRDIPAPIVGGVRVEISLPKQFVDKSSFQIPVPQNEITSSTITEYATTYKRIVTVPNVDSATRLSFTYRFKFLNRVTPEGYTITPNVKVFEAVSGNLLYDSEGIVATSPTITVKGIDLIP